jgi:HK97 family phage major capsid protein
VTVTDDRPADGEARATATPTLADLDGRTPDELHQIIAQADAHIRELHQDDRGAIRSLTEAEKSAMKLLLDVKERGVAMIEEHRAIEEVLMRRAKAVQTPLAALHGEVDHYADVRRMPIKEARDRALRVLGDKGSSGHLEADQLDQVERHVRTDTHIARRILVTETDDYRSAFMKLVTQPQAHLYLTEDERHAIQAFNEFRAMSENTTTAGGFGIPVFIDPSIIMTAQGSGNPFLEISRQVQVNTNQWKGVSSAGVTWTFQTEAAAASDASPTLAQPTVTVHMARGFIPYSIEVDQDYPGFASEMQTLLAEGYDELLVNKFTQGSGSGEPKGILTALSANTNVRVTIQTAGSAFGATDPYKVWKALPQRFRRRASWLMSVGVNNAIRQVGTANVFHAFTDNLPAEWADTLFGKSVYESPYMPDVTISTTTPDGLAIVGDFQNFVIARRGGMSVELINNLVQQVTAGSGPAVPTGQRGWFAYARIGSNSVNDLGFRLLVNS